MRRKPCVLRTAWPEEEGEEGEEGRNFKATDGRGVKKIDSAEVKRRVRSMPLSTMLGLDDEEYRRELGENDERGDGSFCDDKSNDSAREKKEEEEARMLDELLDDD
jgi:hypothetical protein